MRSRPGLRVLAVDDEVPALDELAYLLERDDRVAVVHTSASSTRALELLHSEPIDVVFLDIAMPALTGLELATVLSRFEVRPAVVFVTAHSEHAVDAFELEAVDYVLKPVREDRLRAAVRRVEEWQTRGRDDRDGRDDTIPVELAGVTRLVQRSDVVYVEAQGDYARLHTAEGGSHLVRLSLATLEERWAEAGFLRIHRSVLVALGRVDEVRTENGRCTVVAGAAELPVSRRLTPVLRDRLRRARAGGGVT
jgi:DNA-binding LytR/AlgR family response regulator